MRRRTLLALPALGLVPSALLSACSEESTVPTSDTVPAAGEGAERLTYGDDASQWFDLSRPQGPSRGLVVVIHGGFWKAQYGAEYGAPLAADLVERGWTVANIEYRRVGNGGGWPATADDVSSAIDASVDATDGPGTVVVLGHSAGGHLAAWAAARTRFDQWDDARPVTHVLSQAGVLDLTSAYEDDLGPGAVAGFMGAAPDDPSYDLADPMRHLLLDAPLWAFHARDDDTVPFSQSSDYVSAATAADAEATLVEVAGGHFGLVDTGSEAWASVVEVLEGISPAEQSR